jgi:hypothetical protein
MNGRYKWMMTGIIAAGLCATPAFGEEIVACDEINWKASVLLQFDGAEEACQDVAIRDGTRYVRFEAIFRHARSNGDIYVSVRLHDGTSVEHVFPTPRHLLVSSPSGGSDFAIRELSRGDVLDVYIPINRVVAAAPTR